MILSFRIVIWELTGRRETSSYIISFGIVCTLRDWQSYIFSWFSVSVFCFLFSAFPFLFIESPRHSAPHWTRLLHPQTQPQDTFFNLAQLTNEVSLKDITPSETSRKEEWIDHEFRLESRYFYRDRDSLLKLKICNVKIYISYNLHLECVLL